MKGYKIHWLGFLLLLPFLLIFSTMSAEGRQIGVIMTGDIPYYKEMHQAFAESLNSLVPEGEKIEIILQRPFPDSIAWSNAARKLIAFDVDVIVTYGSPATLAVMEEKSGIPVVYAGVYDPERTEIGGKNITGCGYKVPLSSLLRYLRRLGGIDKVSVVFSGIEEDSVRQKDELERLAGKQNITLEEINVRSRNDIKRLEGLTEDDAVFITGSSLAHLWINDILTATAKDKDPVADVFPDPDETGVLMTLYHPPKDQGVKAAEMVSRILGGEHPENIASGVHRETELVFNLIEANKIGIKLPIQLIVEATRVIK